MISRLGRGVFTTKSVLPCRSDKQNLQFLNQDVPVLARKFSLPSLNLKRLLNAAYAARRHGVFLRKFLWILHKAAPQNPGE